jgi:quinol monooxygenase YgiN
VYITAGHFKFREDACDRAVEIMNQIVSIGRQEQGIQQYTFYPNPDAKLAYFLFEVWDSKEAHDVHFESAEMQSIVPKFFELLDGTPEISYFDASLQSTL